jgi:hypothetical protein
MSASNILRAARNAGLSLSLSPAGKIAYRGPADVLALFKPALVEKPRRHYRGARRRGRARCDSRDFSKNRARRRRPRRRRADA